MNHAILQYFDRAVWAMHNATNETLPPKVKSHLTAAAVHACLSLKESLEQAAREQADSDQELEAAPRSLPHAELIENIRNMDLHGWPLPICDPNVQMMEMVSKPGQPIEISSSHGVGISVHMEGLRPRVRRTPNDLKHATAKMGGATVSCACNEGKLLVHDFSTGKDYFLLGVLKSFLNRCHEIINTRMPKTNEASESARDNPAAHSTTAPP